MQNNWDLGKWKNYFFFPQPVTVALENLKNIFNMVNSRVSLQMILACVHFDHLKAKEEHSFPTNNEMCSLEINKWNDSFSSEGLFLV